MKKTRRGIITGTALLFSGCIGQAGNENRATSTQESASSIDTVTEARSTECGPQWVESEADRARYAVSIYEKAYDGLENGKMDIGAMIGPETLYAVKEEGTDANVPNGLIIEEREGGEVLITLAEYSGSPITDMRISDFYDALEGFRNAQEVLKRNIEGSSDTVKQRSISDGWKGAEEFSNNCDIQEGDLFSEQVNKGKLAAGYLIEAAEKFAEECKVYIDSDAEFEDDIQEAKSFQEEAISKLELAADSYPKNPESLRNEMLVYSGD